MTIKGTVRGGVIYPDEPLTQWEGQEISITVHEPATDTPLDAEWDHFLDFLDGNAMDMGITDLAENHNKHAHANANNQTLQ